MMDLSMDARADADADAPMDRSKVVEVHSGRSNPTLARSACVARDRGVKDLIYDVARWWEKTLLSMWMSGRRAQIRHTGEPG